MDAQQQLKAVVACPSQSPVVDHGRSPLCRTGRLLYESSFEDKGEGSTTTFHSRVCKIDLTRTITRAKEEAHEHRPRDYFWVSMFALPMRANLIPEKHGPTLDGNRREDTVVA
jgi:hypothetical protein